MVDHYYHKGCGDNYKPSSDTTAVWASKVPGHYWYSTNGILTDQPSQYGHLLNLGQSTEVFQLWCCAPSGPLYYRSGNANGGWNGTTWKCLDGKASITTTYVNGTSGYRIWSDGFIEQYSLVTWTNNGTTGTTVILHKAFKNTNYNIQMTLKREDKTDQHWGSVAALSTTSFKILVRWMSTAHKFYWYACGH